MRYPRLAVSAAALVMTSGAAAQTCQPVWDNSIGLPPPATTTGYLSELFVWDDGTGEKLYAGGSLSNIAGSGARFVGAFDLASQTWSSLGTGPSASFVAAITAFDPGDGEKLVVGGANWSNAGGVAGTWNLGMWDGQDWHPTGANFTSNIQSVWALHVWDDGTGPKLYAGGGFDTIAGQPAGRIASWDGTTWQTLADGITTGSTVFALSSFDDGSGDALYVGGRFTGVDHQSISNIARWNGSAWSSVGQGLSVTAATQQINHLGVYDLGTGPELFASGFSFIILESGTLASVASWNGQTWTPIGQSMGGTVRTLVVLDEGEGPTLYAGGAGATGPGMFGFFMIYDPVTNWWGSAGVEFNNTVHGMLAHGDTLYVAGSFGELQTDPAQPAMPAGRIVTRSICPGDECYANCDGSTSEPILTVDDFTCFINEFAAAQGLPHEQQVAHYANCDGSTTAPALTVDDFTCFINAFAAGCP